MSHKVFMNKHLMSYWLWINIPWKIGVRFVARNPFYILNEEHLWVLTSCSLWFRCLPCVIQVSASSDSFLLNERPDIVLLNWPKFASWCSFLLLFFGTLLDGILVCKFSISDFRGQAQKKLKFLIGSRLLGRATPILLPDPPDPSSGPLLNLYLSS